MSFLAANVNISNMGRLAEEGTLFERAYYVQHCHCPPSLAPRPWIFLAPDMRYGR